MLQSETPFPFPGSIAEHDGQRCRVLQDMPGGISLISPIGTGQHLAGHPRRVPTADLVDPRDADIARLADSIDATHSDERRRALWIARHLRDANDVGLSTLDCAMANAARSGLVPACCDTRHLSAILRRLGWRRDGSTGTGYDRTSRYIRTATPLSERAAA